MDYLRNLKLGNLYFGLWVAFIVPFLSLALGAKFERLDSANLMTELFSIASQAFLCAGLFVGLILLVKFFLDTKKDWRTIFMAITIPCFAYVHYSVFTYFMYMIVSVRAARGIDIMRGLF